MFPCSDFSITVFSKAFNAIEVRWLTRPFQNINLVKYFVLILETFLGSLIVWTLRLCIFLRFYIVFISKVFLKFREDRLEIAKNKHMYFGLIQRIISYIFWLYKNENGTDITITVLFLDFLNFSKEVLAIAKHLQKEISAKSMHNFIYFSKLQYWKRYKTHYFSSHFRRILFFFIPRRFTSHS